MKCFEKVGEKDRKAIFEKFYGMTTKNEQDIYIQGLIEVKTVSRVRKRLEKSQNRLNSFQLFVTVNNSKIKICQGAFLSIHAIGRERLKRIQKLLKSGSTPRDRRGKNIKGNAIKPEIREQISNHIKCFPVKESHYSGKDYNYLHAQLNIKIMYNLFKEKYPATKVKYSYYNKFFHENFNLHFGRPQVDTCNVCEELNLKIKSPSLGDTAKKVAVAEKVVHCRRSQKFYTALKQQIEDCKQRNDLEAIAFDYMQNLQLPEIPVQDLFYLSQLSVNVFCIHNLKTRKSVFYIYHEGEGKKSPNEVCTFLMDYIEKYVRKDIKELRLFSDNCPGQNKNHCVTRMCLALTDTGKFEKVQHFFPIRGHSFLPCDRDFGVIKRNLRKFDRIYDVHKYTEIIITASAQNLFTVCEIKKDFIVNFKDWWQKYYKSAIFSSESKSLPRNMRIPFSISKFHHFIYSSDMPGCIKACDNINGLSWHTFEVSLPKIRDQVVEMPTEPAYKERLPILEAKKENLQTLIKWVDEPYKPFYKDIIENSSSRKHAKKK